MMIFLLDHIIISRLGGRFHFEVTALAQSRDTSKGNNEGGRKEEKNKRKGRKHATFYLFQNVNEPKRYACCSHIGALETGILVPFIYFSGSGNNDECAGRTASDMSNKESNTARHLQA